MNRGRTMKRETVEIIPHTADENGASWRPIVGDTTIKLMNQFKAAGINYTERESIKDEAISVLSKCISPSAPPRQTTGLVVGYVQSGKTMSFTTVAALARDNGYQMVIVIAGTSLNLLSQSTNRLEEDLSLLTKSDRKWRHFESSKLETQDYTRIQNVLEDWEDPEVPKQIRQTVLITIMKHHSHLNTLADILSRIDTSRVPTLVIDDEADQASLNTKITKGDKSTTYQRILSLREYLPYHTFLQYTATPQAPLLINLIDVLSPKFAKVLTPGSKYTGGKAFFQDSTNRIRTIPDSEIATEDNPLDAPPDSLLEAMRLFFLGVCAGVILENSQGNRSMMVHPSHKTIGHKQYYHWVKQIQNNWLEILALEPNESDRLDLLEEFRHSYSDLESTVPTLPSFEELSKTLLFAIRKTECYEINATRGRTRDVSWHDAYAYILVGGQAMDRGFTVEGITITYMPRGGGLGNADTIQQRARFFGYKRDYFGYCRVFLENRVRDAYQRYVIHEEDIQERLIKHDATGESLDEWKRRFFLHRDLKPTRRNVLDIEYTRMNLSNQWYTPKVPHHLSEAIDTNQNIVEEFLGTLQLHNDRDSAKRPEFQHSRATNVALRDVYEKLLVPFRTTAFIDSPKFMEVILQIDAYLDSNADALCTVYYMSQGRIRERTLDSKGQIPTLFQGRSSKAGEFNYPGDAKIRGKGPTVQIHILRLVDEDKETVAEKVPAIAVWLPKMVTQDLLIQNQGGTSVDVYNA